MKFSSVEEVQLAYSLGKVATHAAIEVRLPEGRFIKNDRSVKPGTLIKTTVGRVLFNASLPRGMPFYNMPLRSKDLAEVISDCYEILGRRKTIDLLDTLNRIGFRQSTLSGLSFATDDLITPPNKQKIIQNAEKGVGSIHKLYQRGIITEGERYNQVLDAWTHAREADHLRNDDRSWRTTTAPPRTSTTSTRSSSWPTRGARGGVEQIRQLAGMRGLMAKPSGKIIETPIKANFREGLSVLEYFSSTHGARKGLADTALKTADSGYLTRKLADVAQNVVVTQHDCGTTQGITKGVIYRGEKVEVSLKDSIRGRVSRANIVNPITDEVIVQGKRPDHARGGPPHRGDGPGEDPGPQPHDLRRLAGHLRPVLRHGPFHRRAGGGRHGRGHHRRPEHRRTGHAVDDAHLPHRRHGRPPRGRERDQGQEAGRGQVHPHEGRPQRRRTAGRAHPQRRDPRPRPQGPRTGEVRRAHRRQPGRQREPGSHARRAPLPVGPARHPHPRRSQRKGPLRRHHRRRDDAPGEGPQRPRTQADHRSTRATCTRRSSSRTSRARSSTSTTCRKRPTSKSPKAIRFRPARCWPRRPAKWPARRTSPAACPA